MSLGPMGGVDFDPNILVLWLSGDGVDAVDALDETQLAAEITQHFRSTMVRR